MTVYCGVDFHARQQTISCCDTVTGEVQRVELDHQRDDVRAFYAQFTGEVIVGLEASGYSGWFEEMLEELGHTIWMGNPAEIRRKAPRRQKNDQRDADLMLDLMLKGDFPRVHRQRAASRAVMRQLRYRHKLVKLRTIAKNSLYAIGINAGLPLKGKLLTTRGETQLRGASLSPVLSSQRDEWLELVETLDQRVAAVETQLEQAAAGDSQVVRLRTHPGVGLLTALAVRHTLDPAGRFHTGRQVAAYVGLDPVEDSSGPVRRMGGVSKEGSRLLRFLLGQAGHSACRTDADLKRFYQRLVHRRNRPKAKAAVARKLLVRCFIMLRDQIDYAVFVQRGVAARSARKSHRPNVPDL